MQMWTVAERSPQRRIVSWILQNLNTIMKIIQVSTNPRLALARSEHVQHACICVLGRTGSPMNQGSKTHVWLRFIDQCIASVTCSCARTACAESDHAVVFTLSASLFQD